MITRHRSPELSDYPGIYAILRHEKAYVSAPADLVAPIRHWNPTTARVADPDWWHRHLPDWLILGPSVHGFTDSSPAIDIQGPPVHVEPTTPDRLLDLYAEVDPAEWAESGFAGDDIALAWRASDDIGRTIAAANLTPFDGSPTDVGVLTGSTMRRHGAATAIAAVATGYAVREFGIARWRALTTNNASLRIAERLGFEPDSVQIALRPPTP
jgi:RimJ/RimL family protein N-acetyltransferase